MSGVENITITVDARRIPPSERHAAIFVSFDRLALGEALLLLDHLFSALPRRRRIGRSDALSSAASQAARAIPASSYVRPSRMR
jgi:hypothetical protein